MKISIRKVLLINFILVILLSLIITSLISTHMINSRFDAYLLSEHREKINNIIQIINSTIEKDETNPDFDGEGLKNYAMLEGYFVRILNIDNEIIYSTGKSHMMGNGMGMGKGMGSMMGHRFMNNLSSYNENTYPIDIDGKNYGKVIIGYMGPSNISSEAIDFKGTLYISILISSIITIVIGVIISLIISKQIGIPINKITKIAGEISKGNLSIRDNTKTHIYEVSQLSSSINQLSKSLQEQENLRNRMASDMAHEIRTPLSTLKSHVEAFIDGVFEPTEDRLLSFNDEINRINNLVENIENINKVESSAYVLNKKTFNIKDELNNIVESIKPQYNKKNLVSVLENNTSLEVFMDHDKFKQIMYNLLSNAFKYSYEDGIVTIISSIKNEDLIIEVQDFGVGISQEDIPHIFKHLYRGDPSRTRDTGGSGIGLTITKTLVNAHGGNISVTSHPNEGTIFKIVFPLKNITK